MLSDDEWGEVQDRAALREQLTRTHARMQQADAEVATLRARLATAEALIRRLLDDRPILSHDLVLWFEEAEAFIASE